MAGVLEVEAGTRRLEAEHALLPVPRVEVSCDDLLDDLRRAHGVAGEHIFADVLVRPGGQRRAVPGVVVSKSQPSQRVLIMRHLIRSGLVGRSRRAWDCPGSDRLRDSSHDRLTLRPPVLEVLEQLCEGCRLNHLV